MRVLTVKQPYASLIVEGYKKIETRSWYTNYRGKLYIHAGAGVDKDAMERLGVKNLIQAQRCIIGAVNLVDCVPQSEFILYLMPETDREFGHWIDGHYAWILENPQLVEPIFTKGKLGLWEYKEGSG